MTPDQYIQSLQVSEPPTPTYEVDSMSDDELFCLDLLDNESHDFSTTAPDSSSNLILFISEIP